MKKTMSAMVDIIDAAKLEKMAHAREEKGWTVSKEIGLAIREHISKEDEEHGDEQANVEKS